MDKATPQDQFVATDFWQSFFRSRNEMVDVALHDWIAYPAVVLVQVHVVVGGQEANCTTMVGPQLVDNQAFIASKIVLPASRQKVTDDFGEH